MKFSKKDEIDDLKKKLRALKTELKQEMKKEESKDVSELAIHGFDEYLQNGIVIGKITFVLYGGVLCVYVAYISETD